VAGKPAEEAVLLALVDETLRELHVDAPDLPPVRLGSSLDRDLGFDSLGRMELLLRVERTFGVALPEGTLASAETVGDLLRALESAAAARKVPVPPSAA